MKPANAMKNPALIAFALALALIATACAARDTWMTVLSGGRKVGSAHTSRSVDGDRVTTRQSIHLVFDRAGTALAIDSRETDIETTTGKPLSFRAAVSSSGTHGAIRGQRLGDGRFRIERTVAGVTRDAVVDWPAGALLAEGQRLAMLHAALKPGESLEFTAYDVHSGQAMASRWTALARERIDLPDGPRVLLKVSQTTRLPVGASHATAWLDRDGTALKMHLELAGVALDMLACSKACANAPNQPANLFAHAMTRLPHALDARQLDGPLRYVVSSRDGAPLHFASTDEQRVVNHGDKQWFITVGRALGDDETPPQPADTQANAWLEADAKPIIEAARRATGNATTVADKMTRLTAFVRRHIRHKNLSVAYATALQTLDSASGDCTEHAVLLAALARALKIPARVVTGLAYAPEYAGETNVLVPHAWVQAYVDGRWRSYDAALGRFDAGHIALDVGSGDPWRFFAGIDSLGRIRVERVTAVASTPTAPISRAKNASPAAIGIGHAGNP